MASFAGGSDLNNAYLAVALALSAADISARRFASFTSRLSPRAPFVPQRGPALNPRGRVPHVWFGLGAAEAVGIIVGHAPAVVAVHHGAVALIVVYLCRFRLVDGQQVIVGTQAG